MAVAALGATPALAQEISVAQSAPSPEAPIDRVPIARLLRHIVPPRSGAQPPQNAVDNVAIVLGRSSPAAFASSRSIGNNTLRIRHSTSVRPPRLKATPLESAGLNQNGIHASTILSTPQVVEHVRLLS